MSPTRLQSLLNGKAKLPEDVVGPLKDFLQGEPLDPPGRREAFDLSTLRAGALAPASLRAAVNAEIERRNKEAKLGPTRLTQEHVAQHCGLDRTQLYDLLIGKTKISVSAAGPLRGFLQQQPLDLPDWRGAFDLSTLQANALAPAGLRDAVKAEISRRNKEAKLGPTRLTQEHVAQHCGLEQTQLTNLLMSTIKIPAAVVGPLKGFLQQQQLNLPDKMAPAGQPPAIELPGSSEIVSTTDGGPEPMETDAAAVQIKQEPRDEWAWPTSHDVDNSRPFVQMQTPGETVGLSGKPDEETLAVRFWGTMRPNLPRAEEKARILGEVGHWISLDGPGREQAFGALLQAYVIPDDDPREGLRGQQGVRAVRDIGAKEVLGAYAGLYLETEEDFFRERALQGALNVERYNFGCHNSIASVSGFRHGNILSLINACTTYEPGKPADRSGENVGTFEVRNKDTGNKYIFFIALCPIKAGDELLYDYGPQYWRQISKTIDVDNNRTPLLFGYLNDEGKLVRN